jgi:hypothetical protein
MSDAITMTQAERQRLQDASTTVNAMIEAAALIVGALATETNGATLGALEALLEAALEKGAKLNGDLDTISFKA